MPLGSFSKGELKTVLVKVRVPKGETGLTKIANVEVTSVFRERHTFRPGETIRLRPDASRAHLFDASTGQRLAA